MVQFLWRAVQLCPRKDRRVTSRVDRGRRLKGQGDPSRAGQVPETLEFQPSRHLPMIVGQYYTSPACPPAPAFSSAMVRPRSSRPLSHVQPGK
jgi:hypothetical protein